MRKLYIHIDDGLLSFPQIQKDEDFSGYDELIFCGNPMDKSEYLLEYFHRIKHQGIILPITIETDHAHVRKRWSDKSVILECDKLIYVFSRDKPSLDEVKMFKHVSKILPEKAKNSDNYLIVSKDLDIKSNGLYNIWSLDYVKNSWNIKDSPINEDGEHKIIKF